MWFGRLIPTFERNLVPPVQGKRVSHNRRDETYVVKGREDWNQNSA
jgi:hypothetical protein